MDDDQKQPLKSRSLYLRGRIHRHKHSQKSCITIHGPEFYNFQDQSRCLKWSLLCKGLETGDGLCFSVFNNQLLRGENNRRLKFYAIILQLIVRATKGLVHSYFPTTGKKDVSWKGVFLAAKVIVQLYIDFVSLSSNCVCDCVHMLGEFAYNVCCLYLSQITPIQVQTAHWNGTQAPEINILSVHFLRPKSRRMSSLLPELGHLANLPIIIKFSLVRKPAIGWSIKNCGWQPQNKDNTEPGDIYIFLTFCYVPGWIQ